MKWGILITIVFIALLGGALVYTIGKAKTKSAMQENITVTESVTPTSAVSGDSSDAGLANESAAVDAKLKTADQDSANVDAGLKDQQGNLSEQ